MKKILLTLLFFILIVPSVHARTVTYYFNARNSTYDGTWTNPENTEDGSTGTYGSGTQNSVLELLGNTCPGTDLGTISKTEIRVYVEISDGSDQDLDAVSTTGYESVVNVPVLGSPQWLGYFEATGVDTWQEVVDMNLFIDAGFTDAVDLYFYIGEIRVTYSSGKKVIMIN